MPSNRLVIVAAAIAPEALNIRDIAPQCKDRLSKRKLNPKEGQQFVRTWNRHGARSSLSRRDKKTAPARLLQLLLDRNMDCPKRRFALSQSTSDPSRTRMLLDNPP